MRNTIIILLLFSGLSIYGQDLLHYDMIQDVPVSMGANSLSDPWAGGINSAQVNTLDLNGDGIEDLVIWERFSKVIKPFVRQGDNYRFRPDLANSFPPVSDLMLLRDMDGDGKKDLVTSHPLGIGIFINITPDGSTQLSWRPFNNGQEVRTQGINGPVNIAMNPDDIPGIADVDGDGKPDIITFAFLANTLEFNRNISTADSIIFEKVTSEWGDFEVCNCGSFAFGDSCSPANGGRSEHAGAKGIFLRDMDNDNDLDIIITEDNCSVPYLLENTGNLTQAIFRNPNSNFPNSQNPAFDFLYPAFYEADIDLDGKLDLLSSVHLSNFNPFFDYTNSLSYYRNIGTNEIPAYTRVTQGFLQDDMIDLGEEAAPALFDIDNDGDEDLFVGTSGSFNSQQGTVSGRIYFFENTGTQIDPVFVLKDDDWLNLSLINLNRIRPQFADLDGDKNIDLLLTARVDRDFRGLVLYLRNTEFWGFGYAPQLESFSEVFLIQDENTFFHDVDDDGDLDLIILRSTGQVEWFEFNDFTMSEMGEFYGLGIDPDRSEGSILIDDLDGNEEADLLITTKSGVLIYKDFDPLGDPADPELLKTFFSDEEVSGEITRMSSLRFSSTNLMNDDLPSLMVGTREGGLFLLRNQEAIQKEPGSDLKITPNLILSGNEPSITFTNERNIAFDILSITGQQLTPVIKVPAGEQLTHSIRNLADGIYLVRIYTGYNNFKVTKIVLSR